MASKFITTIYAGLNALRHPFLLIIRVFWGVLLLQTGFGKWLRIQQIGDYFSSLGIPLPLVIAILVATIEVLGGISLILGLFSRFFSLLIILILSSAYATAHTEALTKFFTDPTLFTTQKPFLFLYTALIVLIFGPGKWSLDYLLNRKRLSDF